MFGSSSTTSTRAADVAAIVFSSEVHKRVTDLPSNRIEGDDTMITRIRRIGLAIGTVVVAAGLAVAVQASTQNTAGGRGPFMGRGGDTGFGPLRMIASRLGLSDAQQDQIKGILQ